MQKAVVEQPRSAEIKNPGLFVPLFLRCKNLRLLRSSDARFCLAIGFSPYMSAGAGTADFPGELLDEHH